MGLNHHFCVGISCYGTDFIQVIHYRLGLVKSRVSGFGSEDGALGLSFTGSTGLDWLSLSGMVNNFEALSFPKEFSKSLQK